jgi:anti-sigma factor RsiW
VISCAEAVEQLWLVLEDALPETERGSVEEHLAFCRRCCGEVEFAEQLRGLLTQAAEVEVPPEVETRLFGALEGLAPDEVGTRGTRPTPEATQHATQHATQDDAGANA